MIFITGLFFLQNSSKMVLSPRIPSHSKVRIQTLKSECEIKNLFSQVLLMIYHIPAVYKSDLPQYHSSSLLSQAMVIADSSSLGTLTSLGAVRQVVWSGRLSTCGEQKLMVSFVFRFQRNRQTRRYKRTLYTCSQTHLYQVICSTGAHIHQFTRRKCETFHFQFDKLLICHTLLKLIFSQNSKTETFSTSRPNGLPTGNI